MQFPCLVTYHGSENGEMKPSGRHFFRSGTVSENVMSHRHQKWMVRMCQNLLLKKQSLLESCKGSKGILPAGANLLHECSASVPPFTHA